MCERELVYTKVIMVYHFLFIFDDVSIQSEFPFSFSEFCTSMSHFVCYLAWQEVCVYVCV